MIIPDKLLRRVKPYTELSIERLRSLADLASKASRFGIEGDIVECGVASGGSAAILAWASSRDKHVWLYDACTGLPKPTAKDGPYAPGFEGANKTSPEKIARAIALTDVPTARYTIREGLFAETFKEPGPTSIALLHIDCDWYESVTACLERWYDLVSPHGVIVLDDFGFWEGCRYAYLDFCRTRSLDIELNIVSNEQAWWMKP